jgi:uncharacterized membrane protein
VIPQGARVPVHWDAAGHVNGYGSKAMALWLLPALACSIAALFAALARWSPRAAANLKALSAIATASTAVQAAVHLLVVLNATGHHVDMLVGTTLAQALLMLVLGNYMPTLRRNRWIGIRVPWTLRSDETWRRTHELGGRVFMVLGAVVLVLTLIWPRVALGVLVVGVLGAVTFLSGYARRIARDERPA